MTYLTELKEQAKMNSRSFEDILREELGRIGKSVGGEVPANVAEIPAEPEPLPSTNEPPVMPPVSLTSENVSSFSVTPWPTETVTETVVPKDEKMQCNTLPVELLSTPAMQRVVVEHIVKSSEITSQSSLSYKLKPFSGRVPHLDFEVDYDAWHSSVELLI